MIDIIATMISHIDNIIEDEFYTLPTTRPKSPQVRWFPLYDLEEVVVME